MKGNLGSHCQFIKIRVGESDSPFQISHECKFQTGRLTRNKADCHWWVHKSQLLRLTGLETKPDPKTLISLVQPCSRNILIRLGIKITHFTLVMHAHQYTRFQLLSCDALVEMRCAGSSANSEVGLSKTCAMNSRKVNVSV